MNQQNEQQGKNQIDDEDEMVYDHFFSILSFTTCAATPNRQTR